MRGKGRWGGGLLQPQFDPPIALITESERSHLDEYAVPPYPAVIHVHNVCHSQACPERSCGGMGHVTGSGADCISQKLPKARFGAQRFLVSFATDVVPASACALPVTKKRACTFFDCIFWADEPHRIRSSQIREAPSEGTQLRLVGRLCTSYKSLLSRPTLP